MDTLIGLVLEIVLNLNSNGPNTGSEINRTVSVIFSIMCTVCLFLLFSVIVLQICRFIKTAAKPVAAYFKAEAPKSPVFSKICAAIGQSVHKLSSRLNVLVSGYKFVGVKPLEHDVALSKGVEYVAEFIVIGASGGIIMIEFSRSEKKNAIKAAKQAAKEAKMQKVREYFT